MTANDLLSEAIDFTEEYLTEVHSPEAFMMWHLAHKCVALQNEIDYLRKRLQHEVDRSRSG